MADPKQELVPAESKAIGKPLASFIDQDDTTGKTGIAANEITLPRLALAQGTSAEMQPDGSAYLPDLRLFEMFNNLTGESYGRGPLKFIAIKRRSLHIEFDPNDRNIPLDLDVPSDDPRTQWSKDPETGKGIAPAATHFVEFIIMLVKKDAPPEPLILSIKCTNKWNRKAAERLTMFMISTRGPSFAGFRFVESKTEKNDQGTFAVWSVRNGGMMEEGDEQLYRQAKVFSASLEGKTINVKREGAEDASFDVDEMERESGM